jgi:hypothetical protein
MKEYSGVDLIKAHCTHVWKYHHETALYNYQTLIKTEENNAAILQLQLLLRHVYSDGVKRRCNLKRRFYPTNRSESTTGQATQTPLLVLKEFDQLNFKFQ